MALKPVKGRLFLAPSGGSLSLAGNADLIGVTDEDGAALTLYADKAGTVAITYPYDIDGTGAFTFYSPDDPEEWVLSFQVGAATTMLRKENPAQAKVVANALAHLEEADLQPLKDAVGGDMAGRIPRYATLADANDALTDLGEGRSVIVLADETLNGQKALYTVEEGALTSEGAFGRADPVRVIAKPAIGGVVAGDTGLDAVEGDTHGTYEDVRTGAPRTPDIIGLRTLNGTFFGSVGLQALILADGDKLWKVAVFIDEGGPSFEVYSLPFTVEASDYINPLAIAYFGALTAEEDENVGPLVDAPAGQTFGPYRTVAAGDNARLVLRSGETAADATVGNTSVTVIANGLNLGTSAGVKAKLKSAATNLDNKRMLQTADLVVNWIGESGMFGAHPADAACYWESANPGRPAEWIGFKLSGSGSGNIHLRRLKLTKTQAQVEPEYFYSAGVNSGIDFVVVLASLKGTNSIKECEIYSDLPTPLSGGWFKVPVFGADMSACKVDIEDNDVHNVWTGIRSSGDGRMENNIIHDLWGDAMVVRTPANATTAVDDTIGNLAYDWLGCGMQIHQDFKQWPDAGPYGETNNIGNIALAGDLETQVPGNDCYEEGVSLAASRALTLADCEKLITLTAPGVNLTLPSLTAADAGRSMHFFSSTANGGIVSAAAGEAAAGAPLPYEVGERAFRQSLSVFWDGSKWHPMYGCRWGTKRLNSIPAITLTDRDNGKGIVIEPAAGGTDIYLPTSATLPVIGGSNRTGKVQIVRQHRTPANTDPVRVHCNGAEQATHGSTTAGNFTFTRQLYGLSFNANASSWTCNVPDRGIQIFFNNAKAFRGRRDRFNLGWATFANGIKSESGSTPFPSMGAREHVVSHNVLMRHLQGDEATGDGVIDQGDGVQTYAVPQIIMQLPDALAMGNTAAQTTTANGAELYGNRAINTTDPAAYAAVFAGPTFKPLTKAEALAAAVMNTPDWTSPFLYWDYATNSFLADQPDFRPIGFTPENGGTMTGAKTITLYMPTPQQRGVSGTLNIRRSADDTLVESFDVATGNGSQGGTIIVVPNRNRIVIAIGATLAPGESVYPEGGAGISVSEYGNEPMAALVKGFYACSASAGAAGAPSLTQARQVTASPNSTTATQTAGGAFTGGKRVIAVLQQRSQNTTGAAVSSFTIGGVAGTAIRTAEVGRSRCGIYDFGVMDASQKAIDIVWAANVVDYAVTIYEVERFGSIGSVDSTTTTGTTASLNLTPQAADSTILWAASTGNAADLTFTGADATLYAINFGFLGAAAARELTVGTTQQSASITVSTSQPLSFAGVEFRS